MSELDDQREHRRSKLDRLVEAGVDPYPTRFDFDLAPSAVHQRFGDTGEAELEAAPVRLRVPGRVRAMRGHGKVTFLDLSDGVSKLQLFVRRPQLGEAAARVLDHLDLGDLIGASGRLMRTRAGELSLAVDGLELLAKALRPLPEKWHGLTDVEARYRRRYLDLLANPESRAVFERRSALIRELRACLDAAGFLEVETPMMHPIAGGAMARPFRTHHNALGVDLYLRIAPELYLKRLLVGGLDKVYEINRNFRNEGISTRHNPEFTMLEYYWAWIDMDRLVDFTEELLGQVTERVAGSLQLPWQGTTLDLGRPWLRLTMREALARYAGISLQQSETVEGLARAHQRGSERIPLPLTLGDQRTRHPIFHGHDDPTFPVPDWWYGYLLMNLFKELVEEQLIQPTFITDHPVEVSPLAKPRAADPRFAERFELYLAGMEVANGFSELNDPALQERRFREQLAARERGDQEAHQLDLDYVEALEYGMPPAAGEGVGIDRLTMILTDRSSIRDVILFPQLRPEGAPGEQP